MRLHSITLGCQMSAADGSEMSEALTRRGWRNVAAFEDADAVLLNTCTVRQHAEDRALSLLGRLAPWKAEDPNRVLIVAGCMAERLQDWLIKRFPHIDLVVGAKSIDKFPELVETALGARFDALTESRENFNGNEGRSELSPASAFVTIMRGCNYSCSYCIVPAVRGREIYRPVSAVLDDVRRRVDEGAKEIMLLGQTVNSYDQQHEGRRVRFEGLLRLVDRVPGLQRLRFMSPHPYYVTESMLKAMAECPSVCESLHLPVQSGSDRILKLMRRNYTSADFLKRVDQARRIVDGIVLSTDIIVGFPTETDEDFNETLGLLQTMNAASVYGFKFSPRQSTEAAGFSDDVPTSVKEERLARLQALASQLTQDAQARQLGKTMEVLTEDRGFGRTRTNFKVRLESSVCLGRLLPVVITGGNKRTLLGTSTGVSHE